jgi:hypothetical protein
VAARIFDTANPSRSADVPAIRLSEIGNPSTLVFPFAAGGRLNLYVTQIERGAAVTLHVEILSSGGDHLASQDVELSFQHRLLADLLGAAGISGVHSGQIRVTKTGGDGVMWGLLAALGSDGTFTITPGVNP